MIKDFCSKHFSHFSLSLLYLILQIMMTTSNFFLTPLIISHISPAEFRNWISFNAFASLILLSDWGFLNSYRVDMTVWFAKKRAFPINLWNRALRQMKHSSIVGLFLSLFVGTLGLLILKKFSAQSIIYLIIAVLSYFITLYEHLYILKYQVTGQESKVIRYIIQFRFAEFLLLLLVLYEFGSLFLLFFTVLIIRLLSIAFISTNSSIKNMQYENANSDFSAKLNKKHSLGGLFFVISNVLYANILTLLASKLLNLEEFVVFQIARLIVSPIRMLGSALSVGTGQLDLIRKQRDPQSRKPVYFKYDFFVIFGLVSAAFLICSSGPLLWNGIFHSNPFNQNQILYFLGVLALSDGIIWWYSKDFFNTKSHYRLGFINLTLSLIGLTLIPLSFNIFGLTGIPVSLIVANAFLLALMFSGRGRKWLSQ